MIRDIRTVMWKEWTGLFRWGGSRIRALLTLALPLVVFGVYVPWDANEYWLRDTPSLFAAVALPLLVVVLIVPDSFAGERERHTLPTLLASRLPDSAILLGKAGLTAMLGWGSVLAVLVLGLVTLNLAHWNGSLQLYSPTIFLMNISLSLALAILGVLLGSMISLRAATVQEAQQTLIAALMVPPTIGLVLYVFIGRAQPEWQVIDRVRQLGMGWGATVVIGSLFILDVLLYYAARRRFRRSRLISS